MQGRERVRRPVGGIHAQVPGRAEVSVRVVDAAGDGITGLPGWEWTACIERAAGHGVRTMLYRQVILLSALRVYLFQIAQATPLVGFNGAVPVKALGWRRCCLELDMSTFD